jgi:hypothetical protein
MKKFNSNKAVFLFLFSMLSGLTANAALSQDCNEECEQAVQSISSQKEAVDTVWGRKRVEAILRVEKLAVGSPYLAVRMKALEVLEIPIQVHDGNTQAYTIEVVERIVLTGQRDFAIENLALNFLQKYSLSSDSGDILRRAINSTTRIGVQSNNQVTKLNAVSVLKSPQSSSYGVIRDYANLKVAEISNSVK